MRGGRGGGGSSKACVTWLFPEHPTPLFSGCRRDVNDHGWLLLFCVMVGFGFSSTMGVPTMRPSLYIKRLLIMNYLMKYSRPPGGFVLRLYILYCSCGCF